VREDAPASADPSRRGPRPTARASAKRILVVAHATELRAALARMLSPAGYVVELAEGAKRARDLAASGDIDLVVLALEGVAGIGAALARELADLAGTVICVAGKEAPPAGMALIAQPLDEQDVLARIESVLVSPSPDNAPVVERLRFAEFAVDLDGHAVTDAQGRPIDLTRSEFALLAAFARAPGRVLTREQLGEMLGGRGWESYDRSIDMLVGRLRRKIEADPKAPRLILTVPGVGYKFSAGPPTAPAAAIEAAPVAAAPGASERPSIAVLPFANLSGDPDQEYFADGIAEDIITALSRIGSVSVVARSSSFAFKGKSLDAKEIASELGAQYLLEGSVRRAGNRIRITAQLVEAAAGNHVWAERYERSDADLFEVQDDITRSVVASTQTQLLLIEGASAERRQRTEFRSWDLAKRGWKNNYALTFENLETSLQIGKDLVKLDPNFAKGHQVLAASLYLRALMGFSTELGPALEEVQRAIALDDRDEFSHWILGTTLGKILGQHDRSIGAHRRALEINPNFSVALGTLGDVLALAGRAEESIENCQLCIRLNPRDPSIFFRFTGIALSQFQREDYREARDWAERSVLRKRPWWQGHALLAASHAMLGDGEAARAALQELLAVCPMAQQGRLPPLPLKHPEHSERLRAALRQAGFPEPGTG
jgi:adenylate cyclase